MNQLEKLKSNYVPKEQKTTQYSDLKSMKIVSSTAAAVSILLSGNLANAQNEEILAKICKGENGEDIVLVGDDAQDQCPDGSSGTSIVRSFENEEDTSADAEYEDDEPYTDDSDDSTSFNATSEEFCRKSKDPHASDSERTISGVLCLLLPCAMMKDGQCNFDAVMLNPIESSDNTWEGKPVTAVTARMSPVDTGFVGFSYNLGFGFDQRTMSYGEDESSGTSFHYLFGVELDLNTHHSKKSRALFKPEFFAGGYFGFTDFYTPDEDHPEPTSDPNDPNNQSWNIPADKSRADVTTFAGAQAGLRLYLTHLYVTGGVDIKKYMNEIPVLDDQGNLTHEDVNASKTYFFGAGLSF